MSFKGTVAHTTLALVAAALPSAVLAQATEGASRPLSRELAALNPPVPDDLEIPEERRTPAEQKIAAYVDPDWVAPRTSWGHPSLAGTWATDDMRGIPFDRPQDLAAQEFLSGEQFIDRARRQQAGREHAANVETFQRNEWGTRSFGFTSLVVDPPNGRMPALTSVGQARAEVAARQGTFGPGPFDTFEDFSLYDRVHCARLGCRHGGRAVRQRHPDHAKPGERHDHLRDGARDARDSTRWPVAPG